MINSKSRKISRNKGSNSPKVSFKQKSQQQFSSQRIQKIKNKEKFSIQQLLNESSIQKIEGTDLGRRSSRRDLISQSPQHWIGDTSKENINILIMTEQKQIDLLENVLNQPFSLCDDNNPIRITDQNQDQNYQLLQLQYQKLMKQGTSYSVDSRDDEQIITKILNISQIQERKRDDELYNSRRQYINEQKLIQDFTKIIRKIAKRKSDNKILSNSINISRNSQFKQLINKNLFQINQEFDNIQGTNKAKRIQEDDSSFYLKNQINNRVLEEDLFRQNNQNQSQNDKLKKEAVNTIKNYWRRYKDNRMQKPTKQYKDMIHQVKVEELDVVNIQQIVNSKQQDFNNILNELDESSNNIHNDKSQQLSLEYKQMNMMISTKNIVKVNSNSFCEQKSKKVQGDSMVLDHLGSISAIRSTSKFRQASEHDESQIKQQDSVYYYQGLNDLLIRRQLWIKQQSKQNYYDQNWKRKQLDLIQKFRKIIVNPYEPCVPLSKEISIGTLQSYHIDKRQQRSFDFKDLPKLKQPTKTSRTLIQRKTKPLSNHRVNFIKQRDNKQITYIEDKRINIILTKEQVRKLMSRQTITNDIDIFNQNQDISVQTEQILTQLNFSQNQIAPVKTRRIKYNIQLEDRQLVD